MDDTYYSYDPKRKEGARGIAARIRRNKQVLVLAGLAVLFVLGYVGLAGPWATEDLQKDDTKETLRQRILRQNGEHDVVVYSKTWCPYSKRVKRLFQEIGQDYKAYEVNWLEDDEEEYQETLKGITGIRTVPQVFVFGEFVGGSDDTMVAYESGKLERMLAGG
ncbi:glutaredoxin [Chloropicon roscoffensis]|uniref:Glutaredoxin n=1 Tax=Chloropicon roscoffensis TaxID=1461544 RepID=A0AAX4PIH6_9CHLO